MNKQLPPEIIDNALAHLRSKLYLNPGDKRTGNGYKESQNRIEYYLPDGLFLSEAVSEIRFGYNIHDILHKYGYKHGKAAGYYHDSDSYGQFSLKSSDIMPKPLKLFEVK